MTPCPRCRRVERLVKRWLDEALHAEEWVRSPSECYKVRAKIGAFGMVLATLNHETKPKRKGVTK